MKAIHGAKAKNDKIDSQKIAALLRGGLLPQAYVYPAAMRSTRDLLRRRLHLVRKRGQLLAHIQNTRAQYQLPDRRSYAFLCGRLLRDQRQKRIGEVISPEPPANFKGMSRRLLKLGSGSVTQFLTSSAFQRRVSEVATA